MTDEKVIDVQWRWNGGNPKLKFLLWDGNNKRTVRKSAPSLPYTFLRVQDYNAKDGVVREHVIGRDCMTKMDYNDIYINEHEEECYQLKADNPYEIKNLGEELNKKGIKTYEADLNYLQRMMIDNNIQTDIAELEDVLFFDIEADARDGDIDVSDPKGEMLSVCAVDGEGNEYKFVNEGSEEELMMEFLNLMQQYPIVAGYFSRTFDWPFIKNRTANLGIDFDFSNFMHIDVHSIYRWVFKINPASDSLDFVSKKEDIGEKEEEYLGPKDFYKAWRDDTENFLEYNLKDAILAKRLASKYNMIKIFSSMARHTYTTVNSLIKPHWYQGRGINFYKAVETLILNIAQERNTRVVFESRDFTKKRPEGPQFDGADVLESVEGLHHHVIKLDFASLYPNLIKALNIGIDTMDENGGIEGLEANFEKEPQSIFSEAISHLNDLRQEYKDMRAEATAGTKKHEIANAQQFALKQISLASWGSLGYSQGRFFNETVSNEITGAAREVMGLLDEYLREKGHTPVTADTDSSTVRLEGVEKNYIEYSYKLAEEATEYVKDKFEEKHNVENPPLDIEFEKFYKTLFLPDSKKRYAGLVIFQEGKQCMKFEKVGLETQRGDWPAQAKAFQEELIEMKLREKPDENVRDYCREIKGELMDGKYDEDLVTWKGIHKKLDEYDTRTPYVTAAKMMKEEGYNVSTPDKIPYIKYGSDPDDVLPCPKGNVPQDELSHSEYKFLWKKKFKALADRLGYENLFQHALDEFGEI